MTEVIIDTNVLVVANGQNSDVIESCEDACIRFLVQASATGVVLMDGLGEILEEYIRAVNTDRPHGFGARFLFQLIQQQPDRARLEDLDKKEDGEFVDFPTCRNSLRSIGRTGSSLHSPEKPARP